MADISAEELIPLVEQRRVIWDKKSDVYKDKILRATAWREICCILNSDFEEMEENYKKDFVKSVNTKWINIRDAFLRSQKTEKRKMRAGTSKKPRPYVYKNLLSFLSKVNEPETRIDSCNDSQSISSDSSSVSEIVPEKQFQANPPPPTKQMRIENVTLDEKYTRLLESSSEPKENPHISFMKGILPSLSTFDDDENLEFQAGVIALVQKIRRRRQGHADYADVKIFET